MAKAPDWLDDDIREFYNPDDVGIRAIERAIKAKRGEDATPPYMTIVEHMKRLGLARPRDKKKKAKEMLMSTEQTETVEVAPLDLPIPPRTLTPEREIDLQDADTGAAEVHYDAVNEFDSLPAGYAKTIQPMREYTEAEDEALKESIRLFGFISTIVCDQYGRIIDGNQRSRVARWFGKGCPFTITHVRDDAHAMEIATQLNLARRHFTPEQRQQIAEGLREKGRSYRYIAEALHVSHTQARADVREAEAKVEPVTQQQLETTFQSGDVTNTHEQLETTFQSEPVNVQTSPSRVKRKGGGTYPAQRPNGTRPTTSPADRQLAQVINLLMSHAQQWTDQHWQAFLEVVQNLRGSRDPVQTGEPR